MQNIQVKTEGKMLWLGIDTTVDLGPSSSGKTNMVSTSSGFQAAATSDGRQVKFSLNVTKAK